MKHPVKPPTTHHATSVISAAANLHNWIFYVLFVFPSRHS
jgi:hypothetical protein